MSFVTLIIIHEKKSTMVTHHYRVIEQLVQDGAEHVRVVQQKRQYPVDGGYILIDYNKKIVINAQNAFPLPTIKGFEITTLW